MKKKLLKLFLLSGVFFLFSCNNDDSSTDTNQSFFNLNVGSEWVYKEYRGSDLDNSTLLFSGVTDSVKIVAIENFQGFTFAKKSSKKTNRPITYTYVRVNAHGHLIEIRDFTHIGVITENIGLVLHPGEDSDYTFSNDFGGNPYIGTVVFKLDEAITMNVEGNDYLVRPYEGLFTPSVNSGLVPKIVGSYYSKNIGLVKYVNKAPAGNHVLEERLVSYKLN